MIDHEIIETKDGPSCPDIQYEVADRINILQPMVSNNLPAFDKGSHHVIRNHGIRVLCGLYDAEKIVFTERQNHSSGPESVLTSHIVEGHDLKGGFPVARIKILCGEDPDFREDKRRALLVGSHIETERK